MNLLGHAYLSYGDKEILCGNMMGDFVKGKKELDKYPLKIREGLIRHRTIDSFTDEHPAVAMAKNVFRNDFHLYAGPIVDVVFDHFLANDPKFFQSEKVLLDFSHKTYDLLKETRDYQTEGFKELCGYLERDEVLYQYRNLKGLRIALKHLCARMINVQVDETKAMELVTWEYYVLNQHYYSFMDSIVQYVKKP